MAKLQNSLIPLIVQATQEVFTTMILMDVQTKNDSLESTSQIDSNITTMLGLGGEIRGLLAIHFPENVAIGITSSFLGMAVEHVDDDVKDAIGEIANMVAGSLKVFFTENNLSTELAIPTTVVGKEYRTSGLTGAEKVAVVFSCKPGDFVVELEYVLNR